MTITKEEIDQLPVEVFEGKIIVADNIEAAQEACELLAKEHIIGFDTETKPTFKKGMTNKVCLIQLATKNICVLFRLNKIGIPACLHNLLSDSNTMKIGLSLKDDFAALRRINEFKLNGFIDIQALAKKKGIEDQSLQKIHAILFRKRITKGQRLSNWEAEPLTAAQQMYAAIDAWACLCIYDKLIEMKSKP